MLSKRILYLEQFSQEFIEYLPPQSVFVFEQLHYLSEFPSTLTLLANSFLKLLPKHFPCILITHQALPPQIFTELVTEYHSKDLMANELVVAMLVKHRALEVPKICIERVVEISGGRMGVKSASKNLSYWLAFIVSPPIGVLGHATAPDAFF